MDVEYQVFKQVLFDYTRKMGENTNAFFQAIGTRYNLTMIQIRILMELFHNEPYTMGSLAERVHMAGANISTTCKKMEKQGLVTRTRDQDDERIVRIELTEKGILIMEEMNRMIDQAIINALSRESVESQKIIILGLTKFNELLERIVKEQEIILRGGKI